jgi:hypothetical protein
MGANAADYFRRRARELRRPCCAISAGNRRVRDVLELSVHARSLLANAEVHRANSVRQGVGVEVGDVAAWFAAGIAIIAAVFAMISANAARTQAGAALKQASEAEKARKAAEAQVKVAEASVDQAKRSAEAAEASAAEARIANDFEREKYERERADQDAKAVAEAGRVRAHADLTGVALWVFVVNHANETIFDIDVESVIATSGAWRWQIDESFRWCWAI